MTGTASTELDPNCEHLFTIKLNVYDRRARKYVPGRACKCCKGRTAVSQIPAADLQRGDEARQAERNAPGETS
jgi:hypothetical protein